jgi:hypothetical protein
LESSIVLKQVFRVPLDQLLYKTEGTDFLYGSFFLPTLASALKEDSSSSLYSLQEWAAEKALLLAEERTSMNQATKPLECQALRARAKSPGWALSEGMVRVEINKQTNSPK